MTTRNDLKNGAEIIVDCLLAEGVERKEAVKVVAELAGWPKREVYELALKEL